MKKVYKVNCYDLNDDKRSYRFIGNILISKKFVYFAEEVMSGYHSIEILKDEMIDSEEIRLISGNTLEQKKEKRGAGLFILESDLIQKNVATMIDLEEYELNYDKSEYKRIFDEMKILSNKEKQKIKQKVNAMRNIRRV